MTGDNWNRGDWSAVKIHRRLNQRRGWNLVFHFTFSLSFFFFFLISRSFPPIIFSFLFFFLNICLHSLFLHRYYRGPLFRNFCSSTLLSLVIRLSLPRCLCFLAFIFSLLTSHISLFLLFAAGSFFLSLFFQSTWKVNWKNDVISLRGYFVALFSWRKRNRAKWRVSEGISSASGFTPLHDR